MNSINLPGRLTSDPELRATGNGTPVCKLRMATETRRGESVFVDVESYGNGAKAAGERLGKGDQIGVTGELVLDQWKDRETDQPRSRHYIVGSIHFLGAKRSEETADGGSAPAAAAGGGGTDEDEISF